MLFVLAWFSRHDAGRLMNHADVLTHCCYFVENMQGPRIKPIIVYSRCPQRTLTDRLISVMEWRGGQRARAGKNHAHLVPKGLQVWRSSAHPARCKSPRLGEILPKSMAVSNPYNFAQATLPIFYRSGSSAHQRRGNCLDRTDLVGFQPSFTRSARS